MVLGLTVELESLATTTSSLTLAAFALVNFSLWRIKRSERIPANASLVPRLVPVAGFLASAGFLAYELIRRLSGVV